MPRFVRAVALATLFFIPLIASTSSTQVLLGEAFPNLPSFTRPVDLQNAGDGSDRIFVVEQAGRIWVFANDSLTTTRTLFLDIQSRVDSDASEEGLLGLTFHPDYPNSPYFYVNFTTNSPATHTQISRFTVTANPDSADDTSEFPIIEIPKPAPNHNAGQLAFGPDGYLYISTGDGGGAGDPNDNGQDLTTLNGAMLRIDVDNPQTPLNYGIPPDNPYAGNVNGYREEIWAHGFRNPWRFSFDSVTDSLWVGDVGQALWEEIDVVRKGENYGWNIMEGNHCYNATSCATAGLTTPIWEYFHELGRRSITGGYVYRGSKIPEIVGRYIYADYSTGEIWSLEWDGVGTTNTLLVDATTLVSSFGVDEGQELYYAALIDGGIYKLVRDPQTPVFFTAFSGAPTNVGVTLVWDVYSSEGLQGFSVLRAEGSGVPATITNGFLPVDARQYTDADVVPGTAYTYTLVAVMNDGSEQRSPSVTVVVPGLRDALEQNHPNPFNPLTTIDFSLRERAWVTLVIYDATGARVRVLVSEWRDAGPHTITWDGADATGVGQASGVYFYQLAVDGVAVATKRMVLLK